MCVLVVGRAGFDSLAVKHSAGSFPAVAGDLWVAAAVAGVKREANGSGWAPPSEATTDSFRAIALARLQ